MRIANPFVFAEKLTDLSKWFVSASSGLHILASTCESLGRGTRELLATVDYSEFLRQLPVTSQQIYKVYLVLLYLSDTLSSFFYFVMPMQHDVLSVIRCSLLVYCDI
ncbi:hypothetical protein AVEN_6506-1, partial [Araneus ventricosus]